MSTIEDKILDGPTVHYCDADNDDIRAIEGSDDDIGEQSTTRNDASSLFVRPDDDGDACHNSQRISNASTNTGPKGVLEDYRKQSLPKSRNKANQNDPDDLEAEFRALMNDDTIIKQIAEQRLARERQSNSAATFGQVYRLSTGNELLDAIDKEHPKVLVIVHIYTKYSKVCSRVDKCLDQLAQEIKHVKFVTLDASIAGLSDNFKKNGVPALLAYRNSNLIKSLVQLEDMLDQDFDHEQIKGLLVDNGLVE